MAKTMTPSDTTPITDGQINKTVGLYRAMLEKHRSELDSEAVQSVLGQPDFVGAMLGILRGRVEAISDMIVRRVRVDRTRTPQAVLDATGRTQHVNEDVLTTMPEGEGEEADVYFFPLRRRVTEAQLAQEYELRGLTPDPRAQAAVNEANPAFADDRPNGTQWQDANGNWCYAAFDRCYGTRNVRVRRLDNGWDARWWFAGLRKST